MFWIFFLVSLRKLISYFHIVYQTNPMNCKINIAMRDIKFIYILSQGHGRGRDSEQFRHLQRMRSSDLFRGDASNLYAYLSQMHNHVYFSCCTALININ